jgi:hypothetical protein
MKSKMKHWKGNFQLKNTADFFCSFLIFKCLPNFME